MATKSIADYMDELKAEDVVCRIEAYRKLEQMAVALGPQRAATELLTFLEAAVQDEEDEVLVVLADELSPTFLGLLFGGDATDSLSRERVLRMLERLAGAEEGLVRGAAIENLKKFIESSTTPDDFVEMFQRLAAGEWFTTKVAAATILPTLISNSYFTSKEDRKNEMIATIAGYLEDESPMVRRGAIPCLTQLSAQVPVELLRECLKVVSEDAQDSVRLLTMEFAVAAAPHVDVSSLIGKLLKDQSWRVRFMVATHLPKMPSISASGTSGSHAKDFLALLEDGEQEVRAAAAGNLAEMDIAYTPELVQAVQRACQDPSVHVRAAIATQLNALSRLAGPEATRSDIMPLIEELMRDEASQVRLNVVSRLDTLNQVIGVTELSGSLLPAIKALAGDRQWRVRQAILGYFPVLARHLGPSQELTQLACSWLLDGVYFVRKSAAKCIHELSQAFPADWTQGPLKSELNRILLTSKPNYLKREAILQALILIDPEAKVMGELWEMMKRDPIANVRMLVPANLALVDEEEEEDVVHVRSNPPILVD